MSSLQVRLTDLITAIGADIKALNALTSRISLVPTFSFPGSLSLYTGQGRWYNDTGRTLTIAYVRGSVSTQPTGAPIILDAKKNGVTLFTTTANRPTIAVSTYTSRRNNMDVTTLEDQSFLTVDILQIGSTVPGSDLSISIGLI